MKKFRIRKSYSQLAITTLYEWELITPRGYSWLFPSFTDAVKAMSLPGYE